MLPGKTQSSCRQGWITPHQEAAGVKRPHLDVVCHRAWLSHPEVPHLMLGEMYSPGPKATLVRRWRNCQSPTVVEAQIQ